MMNKETKNKKNQNLITPRLNHKWRESESIISPVLRFSPTAWAKLLYFRDRGKTEIGGFAITDEKDLLYVKEFATVKQNVDIASVSFDDEAVSDFFETQVDAGYKPEQFARIWCHTHPGNSPNPSCTDEETFKRVFGRCDWAIMFILATDNKTYARLSFNVGPGGQMLIPVSVDYSQPFGQSDMNVWEDEYQANIKANQCLYRFEKKDGLLPGDLGDLSLPDDFLQQLEDMEPEERKTILDELSLRPDLWEEELEEVILW